MRFWPDHYPPTPPFQCGFDYVVVLAVWAVILLVISIIHS